MSKKTNGNKTVATDNKKNKPKARAEVKEKGPVPNFAQNMQRADAKRRADLTYSIAQGREKFPNLVSGKHGTYFVGTNTGNMPRGFVFDVRSRTYPAYGDMPEKVVTIIWGDVDVPAGRVFVPHSWIFRKIETIRFANDPMIAEVQRDMVEFLQTAMSAEIKEAKQLYYEQKIAQLETAKVQEPAATVSNVISITDAASSRNTTTSGHYLPLTSMLTGTSGIYNVAGQQGQCLDVEFLNKSTGNVLKIKKITQGHTLFSVLVLGQLINVNNIKKEAPQLDAHIRHLFTLRGIRVGEIKQPHNRHVHVTEGLPNWKKATQVA